MVEIKSGNASPLQNAAAAEQSVQNVQDRLVQAGERDDCNRDEADSIDQLLSAVQEMLPQMPQLGLRVETGAAPAAEKMSKVAKRGARTGRLQRSEHEADATARVRFNAPNSTGAGNTGTLQQATPLLPLRAAVDGSLSSPAASGNGVATLAATPVLGMARAGAALPVLQQGRSGDTADAAARDALEASRHADASRKQKGAAVAEEVPSTTKMVSSDAPQHARKPAAATSPMPAARTRADLAAAAQAGNSAAGGATQDGWVYSFRSWGGQHAVRVAQAPGMNSASPSSFASLALHPTTALVEQRLNTHGDVAGRSDQWLLQEYGEEGRQQQQGSRQQGQEEDES